MSFLTGLLHLLREFKMSVVTTRLRPVSICVCSKSSYAINPIRYACRTAPAPAVKLVKLTEKACT